MNVTEVKDRITEKVNETINGLHDERMEREDRINYAIQEIKYLGYYLAERYRIGKKFCDYSLEDIAEIDKFSNVEILRIYAEIQKI